MLMTEYAPEGSEYNKSFLYTELLIRISDYASAHFPHLMKNANWNYKKIANQ